MKKAPRRKTESPEPSETFPGRVTAGHGRHFIVTLESGEKLVAHRRGKKGDVVVGDIVRCTPPVSGVAAIESIEPRSTLLYRSDEWRVKTLAANADLAAIVYAPRPTFNPWFIWKALLAAHQGGIPAVVIRNKTDMTEGADAAEAQAKLLRSIGEEVIEISASGAPEDAREKLIQKFAGETVLMVGQSGMGKSTILNLLVPEAQAESPARPSVPDAESWAFLPPCFSLETVIQTGLSPQQYPSILQSFARNHAQDAALFRHAVRTHDWESLRERAHALKGASANLGALHLRDMARTLELEAQSQLDKGYPNAALSTLQGRPLAALLPELEEALGEVLEAAAKLCPSDKETKPADGPSAIASKPKLDIAKLGTYYNDLVEALLQAAPGRIRIALGSLLVICNADEYPLLHTLKMHVDNYDYEAALTVLERIRPSLFSSSAPSTEPSDAAQ